MKNLEYFYYYFNCESIETKVSVSVAFSTKFTALFGFIKVDFFRLPQLDIFRISDPVLVHCTMYIREGGKRLVISRNFVEFVQKSFCVQMPKGHFK